LLAFTAGTGGSILIIGSAAGVAAMGLEKIDFIWYMKKISLLALLGYFAGIGTYYLQEKIIGADQHVEKKQEAPKPTSIIHVSPDAEVHLNSKTEIEIHENHEISSETAPHE
jgi:Na+/H+ antiporter NhaD/arsenite permease-like protein